MVETFAGTAVTLFAAALTASVLAGVASLVAMATNIVGLVQDWGVHRDAFLREDMVATLL